MHLNYPLIDLTRDAAWEEKEAYDVARFNKYVNTLGKWSVCGICVSSNVLRKMLVNPWLLSSERFARIRSNGKPHVHPAGLSEDKLSANVCKKCAEALRDGKVPAYSVFNGLDFGEIPPELRGLKLIEKLMIAQIIPLVRLVKLRYRGHAHKGNVISLHRDLNEVVKLLPRRPTDLNLIFVRSPGLNGTTRTFTARPNVLRNALEWLKKHNPHYRDIQIDYSYLARTGRESGTRTTRARIRSL